MQIGARLSLPILPAVTTFGLAVGAAAAAKGLSLLHSVMMNALIFALQRIDGYQSICPRVMA
jgi:predicted branched-subunit amino acid permease